MPALPNTKHENFCLALVQGGTQIEAARVAGYTGGNVAVTATKLLKRPEVKARFAELQAERAQAVITRPVIRDKDWVRQQYIDVIESATAPGIKLRAIDSYAKLEGFFIERSEVEVTSKGGVFSLDPERLDSIADAFAARIAELKAQNERPKPLVLEAKIVDDDANDPDA